MRALVCLLLTACGTTTTPYQPPDDAREQGLAPLRHAVETNAPRGRVVDGWLTLKDGSRLVALPTQWNGAPMHGQAVLFEGTPGAALSFHHGEAAFVRYDRAAGKLVWAEAFARPFDGPAKGKPDLSYHSAAPDSEEEPAEVSQRVPIPGQPDALLKIDGTLQLLGADDEVLMFISPYELEGGTYDIEARVARLADGSVVIRADVTQHPTEDDFCGSGAQVSVHVFLPDGSSYVARSDSGSGCEGQAHVRAFPVDGGSIVFEETEHLDGAGWVEWHWRYLRGDDTITLAGTPE